LTVKSKPQNHEEEKHKRTVQAALVVSLWGYGV